MPRIGIQRNPFVCDQGTDERHGQEQDDSKNELSGRIACFGEVQRVSFLDSNRHLWRDQEQIVCKSEGDEEQSDATKEYEQTE